MWGDAVATLLEEEEMATAKQLSVLLGNKPGRLAALCGLLADAKVNIVALSVLENTDMGVVRLVVDKPKEAAKTLKENGLPVQTDDVLVVTLPNKVGIMAKVAAKLAAKKVNIHYVYGSTGSAGGKTTVVLSVDKKAVAARALARI